MKKEVVPKKIFEKVLAHLVNIEEEKEKALSEYFPSITKERMSFEQFISDYVNKIEKYISNCEASETVNDFCPRIIIGSVVEIQDIQYDQTEKYLIISPFENNLSGNAEVVSYLSPMGRALLFKKPDEEVIVETPAGKFPYKILSVKMFEDAS